MDRVYHHEELIIFLKLDFFVKYLRSPSYAGDKNFKHIQQETDTLLGHNRLNLPNLLNPVVLTNLIDGCSYLLHKSTCMVSLV